MTDNVRIGGAYIEIEGRNSDFKRKVAESERAMDRAQGGMRNQMRRTTTEARVMNNTLRNTAGILSLVGVAAGGAFAGNLINTIAKFEQSMSTLKAVTGATAAEMKNLESLAKQLGATTRFSSSQASDGMVDLARAGLSVNEILAATPGVLNLAQAGALSLAEAADIATNVVAGMGLTVQDLPKVLDVLAGAANRANTDVRQLGAAISYAAPIANTFGLTLEETTAALAVFSNNGIKADRAGTALNNILARLSNRTQKGTQILEKYNLTYDDLSVSVNGFTGALRTLAQAQISADDAVALFAIRGAAGGSILAKQREDLLKLIDALGGVDGEAQSVARTMDDNLNGALLQAASATEAFVLALGDVGGSSAARDALEGLASLMRTAAANADVVAAAFVGLATRAVLPLAAALTTKAIVAFRTASAQIAALNAISLRSIGGIGRLRIALSAFGGPVTLAITAAATAFTFMALNARTTAERIGEVEESLRKLDEVQAKIEEDTGRLRNLQLELADAIESQGTAAQETKRLEIDAVQQRIAKNRELADTYALLARAQLAQVQESDRNDRIQLQRRAVRVLGGDRALGIAQNNPNAFDDLISAAQDDIAARQDSGELLSNRDRKFLQLAADFQTARDKANELRAVIKALDDDTGASVGPGAPSLRPAGIGGTRGGSTGGTGGGSNDDDGLPSAEDLARQAEVRAALEQQYAVQLAQARLRRAEEIGIESLIQQREQELAAAQDRLSVQRLTNQLINAGVPAEEARKTASDRVLAVRRAELETVENIHALMSGGIGELADDLGNDPQALSEFEQAMRDRTTNAILQGIQTDDWGQAFKDGVRNAVAEGMQDSIRESVDLLFDLLKDVDWGDVLGTVTRFFGGARAAGGRVTAGNSYTVGELGPETFVPDVDGFIAPKAEPRAGGIIGAGMGGTYVNAPFTILGHVTDDFKEIAREEIGAFSRSMPRIIRAEVRNGQNRGAYG